MTMLVDFAKMAPLAADVQTVIAKFERAGATKEFCHGLLEKKAQDDRHAGESKEQAYSRLIMANSEGRALFAAYQRAPHGEGPALQPVVKAADGTQHLGPAHARLHAMAVDHARAHSRPYESAYSYLYSHPDYKDLRAQVHAEYMANAVSAIYGPYGSVAPTLTIGEAQGLDEPAPPFRNQGVYQRDVARKSSAESELESLARQRHAVDSSRSYEQHFVKVMLENPAIAKRARDERAAALGCKIAV